MLHPLTVAYDKAVTKGTNDLSQYISIKAFIEAARPANVLVIGGGHDVTMYVEAAKAKDADGVVLVLESRNEWIETMQIEAPGAICHLIEYVKHAHPEYPHGINLELLTKTDWDVILVDPGPDPQIIRDACYLAKRIKLKKTWLYVAVQRGGETIPQTVQGQLGETQAIVKGYKSRQTAWWLYEGEHRPRPKKNPGIIKQV
jgi:hypothetical protein